MKKAVREWLRRETGVTLVESVVALALMGVIAVGFLSGVNTLTGASVSARDRAIAESLAKTQLEYAKNRPYNPDALSYPLEPTLVIPEQWTVLCAVQALDTPDSGLQRITVTVQYGGVTQLLLDDYKVNR